MLPFLTLVLISFSFSSEGQPYHFYAAKDIRSIPPAQNLREAKETLKLRRDFLVNHWALRDLNRFPFHASFKDKGLVSLTGAVARLVKGKDIQAVNDYLLDKRFQPGLSGTRIDLGGLGICKRHGDYDFILQELIRIAYLEKGQLSSGARKRLRHELLNQTGSKHYSRFNLGVCGRPKDTENHILMTESARYLTNQLLFKETPDPQYDNEANGFNQWLVNHMRQFYIHGFSEINSKPYAGFTISALLNLHDFAGSPQVKMAAKTLLDYLSMKYAMESLDLRRYPTFRRQKRHYNNPWLHHRDAMSAMFIVWSGNYGHLYHSQASFKGLLPFGDRFAFNAAISSYFPEDVILNNIFEPEKALHFSSMEHGAKQVSFLSKDFLISGGGVHRPMLPPLSLVNDVLAAPTVLIPRGRGDNLNQLFYFEGKNQAAKRSNLCVAENFLCGFNLHVPKNINPSCFFSQGDWTFYDFTKQNCNSVYRGLYLAVYKKQAYPGSQASNFGFIEARKADDMGFFEFVSSAASKAKASYNYKKAEQYETTQGNRIVFKIDAGKGRYEILAINGQRTTPSKNWARAWGERFKMNGKKMTMSDSEKRLIYLWDVTGASIRTEAK